MVIIGLGKNLLFKSVLAHCAYLKWTGGSEKVQNYADVIYGLARMDAARLRMLEDTDDLRTMQKEKLVILFIKVDSNFILHSFIHHLL